MYNTYICMERQFRMYVGALMIIDFKEICVCHIYCSSTECLMINKARASIS